MAGSMLIGIGVFGVVTDESCRYFVEVSDEDLEEVKVRLARIECLLEPQPSPRNLEADGEAR